MKEALDLVQDVALLALLLVLLLALLQRTAAATTAPPAGQAPAARPAGAPAAGAGARQAGGMAGMLNNGFEAVLVDELVPYVDANFRTIADQAHRAMGGLSMGGMETKR